MPETTAADSLSVLLDELDAKAEHENATGGEREHWVCQRKHPRHPFRADCRVSFFPPKSENVAVLNGRTRNLSRGGVAIVVKRLFRREEAVEVELLLPDRPKVFMAGVARFCRYAGAGFYEVGILLHCVAGGPVFSQDPDGATEHLEWLRAAREAMHHGT